MTTDDDRLLRLENQLSAVEKDLAEARFEIRQHNERLQRGAQKFDDLSRAIKPPGLGVIARTALPIALILGSWVWAIARYPDAEEVRRIVTVESPYARERAQVLDALQDLAEIHHELRTLAIEQAKVSERLQRVLNDRPTRPNQRPR